MNELEQKLQYTFQDKSLLENALRHSSYANENRNRNVSSNERLEFLGDSVLGFVTAKYLYKHFPQMPEGRMTKLRAELVCEAALSDNYSKRNNEIMNEEVREDLVLGRNAVIEALKSDTTIEY
ncbi:MAG: hypothetical protein IIV43_06025, partial [Oscillospiraceae bacterium]|nr:hypothetical protein [Oscillospiraceae bacterium]